jgi:hypothetical protein
MLRSLCRPNLPHTQTLLHQRPSTLVVVFVTMVFAHFEVRLRCCQLANRLAKFPHSEHIQCV